MAITEKYCTTTGAGLHDGTSEANAWDLSEAFANAVAGDRINLKADGTYTLAADLNPTNEGSTSSPIIIRGYTTTIGDAYGSRTNGGPLDTSNMPTINTSTYEITHTSSDDRWVYESINITSAHAGATMQWTNYGGQLINCNVENTVTAGTALATFGGTSVVDCDLLCSHATSNQAVTVQTLGAVFYGCRIKSAGGRAFTASSGNAQGPLVVVNCLIYECGTDGFFTNKTNDPYWIFIGNTFDNCGDNAVEIDTGSTTYSQYIIANHVTNCGRFFANDTGGGLSIISWGNRTRDNTSADTGMNDWPHHKAVTTDLDDAGDYEDASSDDYRLIAGAPGEAGGAFGMHDIGAYPASAAAAAGGDTPISDFRNLGTDNMSIK